MPRLNAAVGALLAVMALTLSGCGALLGGQPEEQEVVYVTSTASRTSSPALTTSAMPTTTATTAAAVQSTATQSSSLSDSCDVVGFTGAPGVSEPQCLNKTVSYCGTVNLHEYGTTFFTDGTSGWTETCAAQMGTVSTTPPPYPFPPDEINVDVYITEDGYVMDDSWDLDWDESYVDDY